MRTQFWKKTDRQNTNILITLTGVSKSTYKRLALSVWILLLLLGFLGGLLSWYEPPGKLTLFLITNDTPTTRSPYWALTQGNVSKLKQSNLFHSIIQLDEGIINSASANIKENGTNLIYIDCRIMIDKNKDIILNKSTGSVNETNKVIRLVDLIEWINLNLKNNSVLVLNFRKSQNSIYSDFDSNNLGNILRMHLNKIRNKNLIALLPNISGSPDLPIPGKNYGLLVHFLIEGLKGAADPFTDFKDGTINSIGLIRYLNNRMSTWSNHFGFDPIHLYYWKSGSEHFLIRKIGSETIEDFATPDNVEKYPEWLVSAWNQIDEWRNNRVYIRMPLFFNEIQNEVQHIEDLWRIGYNADELKNTLLAKMSNARDEYKNNYKIPRKNYVSIEDYLVNHNKSEYIAKIQGSTIDLINTVRNFEKDPKNKPDEKTVFINNQIESWYKKIQVGSDIYSQSVGILLTAFSEKWEVDSDIILFKKCLDRIGASVVVESALLEYIHNEHLKNKNKYSVGVYYELFRSRCLREKIFAMPEIWPAIIGLKKQIFEKQHELELIVLFGGLSDEPTILQEIKDVNRKLNAIQADLVMLKNVRDNLYLSLQDINWLTLLLDIEPEKQMIIGDYIKRMVRLADALNVFYQKTENMLDSGLKMNNESLSLSNQYDVFNEIRTIELNSQHLQSERTLLFSLFNDQTIINFIKELNQLDSDSKVHITRFYSILRFPYFDSISAEALWNTMLVFLKRKSETLNFNRIDDNSLMIGNLNDNINNITLSSKNNLNEFHFPMLLSIIQNDINMKNLPSNSDKSMQESTTNAFAYYEKLRNDWSSKDFRYSRYSEAIKSFPGFSELLDQLFEFNSFNMDRLSSLSANKENRSKIYDNQIIELRNLYATDFATNSLERKISDSFLDFTDNSVFGNPVNKIEFSGVIIDSEFEKRGKAKMHLELSFLLEDLKNGPLTVSLLNQPGTLMGFQFEPVIINSSDLSDNLVNIKVQRDIIFSGSSVDSIKSQHERSLFNPVQTVPLVISISGRQQHMFVPMVINWESIKPVLHFHSSKEDISGLPEPRFRPFNKVQSKVLSIQNSTPDNKQYKVVFTFNRSDNNEKIVFESGIINLTPNGREYFKLNNPVVETPGVISTSAKEISVSNDKKSDLWPGSQVSTVHDFLVEIFDLTVDQKVPIVSQTRKFSFFTPREYFNISTPIYDAGSRKLSLSLQGDPSFRDSQPSQVALRLDSNVNILKSGSEAGGKLDAIYEFQSESPLILVAQPISPPYFDNGLVSRFWVDIDDYKRAYCYQNRWTRDTSAIVNPSAVVQPEIILNMPAVATTKKAVSVFVEPLNEPDNSQIILEISSDSSGGPFNSSKYRVLQRFSTSRRSAVAVGIDAKSGSLLVNTNYGDWNYDLQTAGLVGKVRLRARMLDEYGKEIAQCVKDLFLDDQLPQNNSIINLPKFIKPGSIIDIGFATVPPPAGIAEITAVPGPITDGKTVDGIKPVILKPVERNDEVFKTSSQFKTGLVYFAGKLQIPDKPQWIGDNVISVVAKTNAGETVLVQHPIRIVAADFLEPGSVSGIVILGDRSQPGLPVVLRKMDKNRTEVARVKTDSLGFFRFQSVPVGNYGIFTARSVDQTSAQAEVNVEPGKNTELKLILGRVNLPSNGPPPQEKTDSAETKKQ